MKKKKEDDEKNNVGKKSNTTEKGENKKGKKENEEELEPRRWKTFPHKFKVTINLPDFIEKYKAIKKKCEFLP